MIENTLKIKSIGCDILKEYGQVKKSTNKRFTFFFLLSYETASHNIKIEISKKRYPNDRFELKQYLGFPILVIEKSVVVAYKLVAITDRSRMMNRDLFDAHFFLKHDWPIDSATVEYRTNQKLSDNLKRVSTELRKNPPKHILDGMGELLDDKQKIWVNSKLIEELLFLLELKAKIRSEN